MRRSSWALPVIISAVGLTWIVYLGLVIWRTPDAGRATEQDLARTLVTSVQSRDAATLQSLFSGPDLPSRYAQDYLAQVPVAAAVSTATTDDAAGSMLTLRVGTGDDLRCTTWRVQVRDQLSLSAAPVLTAPCPANSTR